ncbi:DUF3168 domain-containing protein [Streptococcus agalactiae]|uniref:DUF3168 domain-containing protein n=1 Tax=Streptococcus agalactiae TaxID=1311 RepID=UPI0002F09749|nr:DUF3168 domain-containing protein [Streptococcus agalactiae]WFZ87292.1 capsid and scaffold protein [Streptococcus phage vB_Sags-UPM1]AXC16570.1 DUF3168 domain-containing protein [Streptococcus agalactiae]EPW82585.1 hypothetical protein SAG0124_02910 [Streptococcus agalactiae STIR-CD-14]KAF1144261.1 hypothetical protein B8V13_06205 [Streptococcus agalactiae]KAF1165155.1 hypothetical protein B8V22_09360 [Streptococcus agalactiae]
MKQPDQVLFDEIFTRIDGLGFSVYDFLPPTGTKYPFVVMGDTHIIPMATKTQLIGKCSTTINVWGDSTDRKVVSDMIAQIMLEVSKISQIDDNKWAMVMNESDTQILKDNSTNENLYHGILNIYFNFV